MELNYSCLDGLSTYIFKHYASEIASNFQMLYTQSLNTCTLPEGLLTGNITPVYKKGSRNIQYHQIIDQSLTSVCSKMMEHIVFHPVIQHV